MKSDSELINSINAGDANAFDTLYARYRDWVYRLARRFTGNHQDALDVLQETFTYLLQKFPGFIMAAIVDSLEHPDQGQTDTDPNHQGVDSEKLSPTDQINQDAGSDPSSIPKESPPKKNRWFSFFRKRS